MFVYFWLPDFICQALSYFNWMTWISPMNVFLAAVTGGVSGLGFNPLPTFDWNQITVVTDPLISPFFATFNASYNFLFLGALVTFPIIVAIWYTNTWNTGYLPINSNFVFDNTANRYSVANATGTDNLFNQTMYENYSPPYLSASQATQYGIFFALYTATLSYSLLNHRREIMHVFRSTISRHKTFDMHKDVHVRLMESYKEVTEWEYLMQADFGGECSSHELLQGWDIIVLKSLILDPSQSYGFVTTYQTISFASGLKLAHYMHIPPQLTFSAQIYATVISTFVCTGVLNFQMTKIPGVCIPDQPDHFTCPDINEFFTASVFWGTIGPKRMFGPGGIYNGLLWCFLIGAILPIPYIHIPVLLAGSLIWAPYSLANIWPAVPIGYLFNVFIKRRYVAWWSKYNYITTAAFSTAIAVCAIVIFFAIEWPGVQINWSGNTRPFEGCDAMGCARLPLPTQGFFDPVGRLSWFGLPNPSCQNRSSIVDIDTQSSFDLRHPLNSYRLILYIP
ncbi:OPT oligopeptide transporter protein-domain-containing protein [Mycena sanguinolenta]|nr:OPT oligopeptide transporter protein-domain-containing protein [Mycena sanguinolenta]